VDFPEGLKFLCLAWGETDFPVTRLVDDADGVAQFFCDEWFGGQPIDMHREDREVFDEAMARVRAPKDDPSAWDGGCEVSWTFEIGGISVRRVYESTAK
jgi:hypothetical protein